MSVIQAIYLLRSVSAVRLLTTVAILSLVLAFVLAALLVLFPHVVLDWLESGVLMHGSIDDIETLRRLREGGL